MEGKVQFLRKLALKGLIGSFAGIYTHLISGNILPCSSSNDLWLVGHMLVGWMTFFLFSSHGFFGLKFEHVASFKLGGGYSIMFGGILIHICHAHLYMHFHFLYFENSKKILFLSRQICNVFCFVLTFDIIRLDLYSWMSLFLNYKGVHGLRMC